MRIKNKHGIWLILIGMTLVAVGASLKIMHATGANGFLLAGMIAKMAGMALLLLKSLRHTSVKQWLNS